MSYTNITAFAVATPDAGCRNQILGAFRALSGLTGQTCDPEKMFVLPENVQSIYNLKESLQLTQINNYAEFRREMFVMFDAYFKTVELVPRIFITVYNLTESKHPEFYTDMLCHAVKDYYAERKLGRIFTTVLTSKLYSYKYVDLINVPKHLLTFSSRIRLLRNQELRKKVLITIGTINNFNIATVREKYSALLDILEKLKQENDPLIQNLSAKYEAYAVTPKKVVFCLGGRVSGSEIIFGVSYANKLYGDAECLATKGYGIVFVNGPRTPNEVVDFLYEKSLKHPSIIFQNCKRIAESDEDREPGRWRIYSGKYEEDFRKYQFIGNIYPGILGFPNTLAVHTADTYSCCETANAAITTAISVNGIYINPEVRYDCLNLYKLLCPKYIVDFDDFVQATDTMRIEPRDIRTTILSSPLRVFAETVLNCLNRD